MKSLKKIALFSSVFALGLGLAACNDDEVSDTDSGGETGSGGTSTGSGGRGTGGGATGGGGGTGGTAPGGNTIVDIASGDDRFSILVDAVVKAGLAEALGGPNLTVFAPTNDAFADLLEEIGADSLADLSAAQLKPILLYHVLGSKVDAAAAIAAAPGDEKTASLGGTLDLSLDGETLKVDAASVTTADIMASNGIIHVIDSVLLPSITDIVTTDETLTGLKGLVVAADGGSSTTKVAPALDAKPSNAFYTLFAPSNAAVAAVTTVPSNLTDILLYHVHQAAARVTSTVALGLTSPTPIPTLLGETVTVTGGSAVTLTDSTSTAKTVQVVDLYAENGIIHVINGVLIP